MVVIYGRSVYPQPQFSQPGFRALFPTNLIPLYDQYWAFIPDQTGRAVVVGEWGGDYTGQDATWQDFFGGFLGSRGLTGTFYWTLNPTSAKTGGILADDWSTLKQDKLSLLATTQPSPTKYVQIHFHSLVGYKRPVPPQ